MELEIKIHQKRPLIEKEEFDWYGDHIERWTINVSRDVQVIRNNYYNSDTWVKIDEDVTNMDFSEVRKFLEDKLC